MTTRLDGHFNPYKNLIVEVSQTDDGWALVTPGVEGTLRCRRLTQARAVLYDTPRSGIEGEPALSEFDDGAAILVFREGASEIASAGDQVLVSSSTWPGDFEVILTHDVRAQDRELSIFTVVHQPGFSPDEKQRSISIDKSQIQWLAEHLSNAAQRLPDPVTGEWDRDYLSW